MSSACHLHSDPSLARKRGSPRLGHVREHLLLPCVGERDSINHSDAWRSTRQRVPLARKEVGHDK